MKYLSLLATLAAPACAALSWSNVNIGGGGGFVSGILFHPKTKGVVYARTDIGGLYRQNSDESWTAITDSIATDASWGNWGTDAIAIDPQDDTKIYAAFGTYTNSWDPNMGSIGSSSDRGNTWKLTKLPFKVGGNMPGRGMGERLAVDPANSKIIYFGARSGNGLWKSTDGGATFAKVSSFTAKGDYAPQPGDASGYNSDLMGLAFVTFDSTSALVGGATSRIFVGVASNTTEQAIWQSTDAGATWSAVAGQPSTYFPHKCKLSTPDKALYLSYSDGTGPYDGTKGAVWRFDLTSGAWKDITPVSGSDLTYGFGGLTLDAKKPGVLMVAALNSWWPEGMIWRSQDYGATWSPIWQWISYPDLARYYSISSPKAPWIITSFVSKPNAEQVGWMMESVEINPFDSDNFYYGTGLTLYGSHDLTSWDTAHNISIQTYADGIEEMAVLGLASAPGSTELLVAVGDDSGFSFKSAADLKTSPQSAWETPFWSTTTDVDFAGNKPSSIVRSGNSAGAQMVAVSTDGGFAWNVYPGADTSTYGGQIAYSADADTIVWSSANNGVLHSQYSGAFTAVTGLAAGAVIASDKRNGTVFYGAAAGAFYVSTNGGVAFTKAGALGAAKSVSDIAAHPTVAGTIYVGTDAGVFKSTNYGASFTALSTGVTAVGQISLGIGSGSSYVLYAIGTGSAGNKLYASSDDGASWTDIQGAQGFGSLNNCKLAGSNNVANQVYVGTNGRGVFVASGAVSGSAPATTAKASTTSVPAPTTSLISLTRTVIISPTAPASSTTTLRTTTSPSKAPTTTSKAPTTTSKAATTSVKTTLTTTAVKPTTTTTKAAVATTSAASCSVAKYGQCGGQGFTGCTVCASGSTCTAQNTYYMQCL